MIDDGLIVDEQGKVDEKEKEVYKAWVDEWAEWIMNELPSESRRPNSRRSDSPANIILIR
jgi:hypothetical protein